MTSEQTTVASEAARALALSRIKAEIKRRQAHVQALRKKANATSGERKHHIHMQMRSLGYWWDMWSASRSDFKHPTRAWCLAYAFLKGIPYPSVERTLKSSTPSTALVSAPIVKILRKVLTEMPDLEYEAITGDARDLTLTHSRTLFQEEWAAPLKTWFGEPTPSTPATRELKRCLYTQQYARQSA